MNNIIICRKCQGNHFTIKCGKEQKIEDNKETIKPEYNKEYKPEYNKEYKPEYNKEYKPEYNKEYKEFNKDYNKEFNRQKYKVKIMNFPADMTERELMELTFEWGHITRLSVLNYFENSTAFIEFGMEEQANHFVKALDKTPFEHIILSVSRID